MTKRVEQVSVMLIASLIVVLSALLSVCTNRGGRGRTTRGKERPRAPGRPMECAQQGRGRNGNAISSHIALLSARTDRGGWSRVWGQGQYPWGARPNTAK